MRIICLVPSITETLLKCNITLVGRSRFCIHPQSQVKPIPKVGGTKDIDWQKTLYLKPDLVILDKEENTKAMADTCPYELIALHITHINDVSLELTRLANYLNNNQLKQIAQRWRNVAQQPINTHHLNNIPGIIQWWKQPTQQTQLEYLIWKDPWMAIGQNTFIQSMLEHCGLKNFKIVHTTQYPVIKLESMTKEKTLLLFSSEPYPFHRYQKELLALGYACALIDGEKFSWYGIRSLEFLEDLQ